MSALYFDFYFMCFFINSGCRVLGIRKPGELGIRTRKDGYQGN